MTERKIFRYHDGTQERWADPLVVNRSLWRETDGRLNKILEDCQSQDESAALAASDELLRAVRLSFDLPALDTKTGTGTTEDEAIAVLNGFLNWLEQKKTKTASEPTLPPPSASAS